MKYTGVLNYFRYWFILIASGAALGYGITLLAGIMGVSFIPMISACAVLG